MNSGYMFIDGVLHTNPAYAETLYKASSVEYSMYCDLVASGKIVEDLA